MLWVSYDMLDQRCDGTCPCCWAPLRMLGGCCDCCTEANCQSAYLGIPACIQAPRLWVVQDEPPVGGCTRSREDHTTRSMQVHDMSDIQRINHEIECMEKAFKNAVENNSQKRTPSNRDYKYTGIVEELRK